MTLKLIKINLIRVTLFFLATIKSIPIFLDFFSQIYLMEAKRHNYEILLALVCKVGRDEGLHLDFTMKSFVIFYTLMTIHRVRESFSFPRCNALLLNIAQICSQYIHSPSASWPVVKQKCKDPEKEENNKLQVGWKQGLKLN